MKFRSALPLAAGLAGLLFAASVPLSAEAAPSPSNKGGSNKGRATGNPFNGNRGQGPNPSRGNAGFNAGVTSPTSSVLAPTVRFAPGRPIR